jgi:hypothetical protein
MPENWPTLRLATSNGRREPDLGPAFEQYPQPRALDGRTRGHLEPASAARRPPLTRALGSAPWTDVARLQMEGWFKMDDWNMNPERGKPWRLYVVVGILALVAIVTVVAYVLRIGPGM